MSEDYSVFLEKDKIYKLICTRNSGFKRKYIIFSPKYNIVWFHVNLFVKNVHFSIDLDGGFNLDSSIGIGYDDSIEPLTIADWFELGQMLKHSPLKCDIKYRKIIDTRNFGTEIEEI